MIEDDVIWSQKYRPTKVKDTILPVRTKAAFQKYVDEESVPNLLLHGPPGTGKTTAAKAMLEEIGSDYIVINGSLNMNMDTLRTKVSNYASAVSLGGGRKYVIIDESDYLSATHVQPALRNFMEEYSKNCGFIFTCNAVNKIIKPLHSRFSIISFRVEKKEVPSLAAQFFKRVLGILDDNNVEYDKKVVAKVVENFFPDFRRTLNELQSYASTGKIDEGIFVDIRQDSIDEVFAMMKAKNFTSLRKWAADNADMDANEVFTRLYHSADKFVDKSSMPGFVVTLNEYAFKNGQVADPEINMVAFLTEVMVESVFK